MLHICITFLQNHKEFRRLNSLFLLYVRADKSPCRQHSACTIFTGIYFEQVAKGKMTQRPQQNPVALKHDTVASKLLICTNCVMYSCVM